jgi:archaellum component FlaF (FlaF/FlaG flagellin family)
MMSQSENGSPQIIVRYVEIPDGPLRAMSNSSAQFEVLNTGNSTGSSNFTVSINGKPVTDVDIGPLRPGQSTMMAIDFYVPESDQVTVSVGGVSESVDVINIEEENGNGNRQEEESGNGNGQELESDIVVQSVDILTEDIKPGEDISIEVVFYNKGPSAGASSFPVYVNGSRTMEVNTGSIISKGQRVSTITATAPESDYVSIGIGQSSDSSNIGTDGGRTLLTKRNLFIAAGATVTLSIIAGD